MPCASLRASARLAPTTEGRWPAQRSPEAKQSATSRSACVVKRPAERRQADPEGAKEKTAVPDGLGNRNGWTGSRLGEATTREGGTLAARERWRMPQLVEQRSGGAGLRSNAGNHPAFAMHVLYPAASDSRPRHRPGRRHTGGWN